MPAEKRRKMDHDKYKRVLQAGEKQDKRKEQEEYNIKTWMKETKKRRRLKTGLKLLKVRNLL